jgi:hypothetical protein
VFLRHLHKLVDNAADQRRAHDLRQLSAVVTCDQRASAFPHAGLGVAARAM